MAYNSSITSGLYNDNASDCRHTVANYYAVAGVDSYGQATVSEAVSILVRVEKEVSQVVDPQGNTVATDSLINVDRDMAVGGIIQIGTTGTDYHQIVAVETIPSIDGAVFDRNVRTVRFKNELPTIVS